MKYPSFMLYIKKLSNFNISETILSLKKSQ